MLLFSIKSVNCYLQASEQTIADRFNNLKYLDSNQADIFNILASLNQHSPKRSDPPNDVQRLRIWPVAIYELYNYLIQITLDRITKFRIPNFPAIGYMRCCAQLILYCLFHYHYDHNQYPVFF
jgi:hypothetical protein